MACKTYFLKDEIVKRLKKLFEFKIFNDFLTFFDKISMCLTWTIFCCFGLVWSLLQLRCFFFQPKILGSHFYWFLKPQHSVLRILSKVRFPNTWVLEKEWFKNNLGIQKPRNIRFDSKDRTLNEKYVFIEMDCSSIWIPFEI